MQSESVTPAPIEGVVAPASSPSKKTVTITDGAVEYAKKRLAQRGTPDAAVRLGVRGGGCSGFSYVIEFADDPPKERDLVFVAGGVRFYVDKKSFVYLAGSALDYEKTLVFQGFKFKNPQEASRCGCGHSFTVR
jgi:iron-sulfur cluster assembly protein